MNNFTNEELSMISDALLQSMQECDKAYNLVNSWGAKEAIRKERETLQALNIKVCNLAKPN